MFADTSSQGFSVSEAEKPKAEGPLARDLCPCDFPDNTGVGCHSLLQGSNLCLLRWQADSLPLSHQRSPKPQLLLEIRLAEGPIPQLVAPPRLRPTQSSLHLPSLLLPHPLAASPRLACGRAPSFRPAFTSLRARSTGTSPSALRCACAGCVLLWISG